MLLCENKNIFNMNDWKTSFNIDCKINTYVDIAIFEHFLSCLPPRTLTKKLFQVGEAYSYNGKGEKTYTSFIFDSDVDHWLYVGELSENELLELKL